MIRKTSFARRSAPSRPPPAPRPSPQWRSSEPPAAPKPGSTDSRGGAEAIDFYERAFGAEVTARLEAGGMLVHAAIRIGDSLVTLCDPMPSHGMVAPDHEAPVTSFITLYVEDADALHAQALAAGATEINPIADHIHGDRAGSVRDPFGHRWAIATHIEDVSEAEMSKRMEAFASRGAAS